MAILMPFAQEPTFGENGLLYSCQSRFFGRCFSRRVFRTINLDRTRAHSDAAAGAKKRSFFCTLGCGHVSPQTSLVACGVRSALHSAGTCQPCRAPGGHREVDLTAAPAHTRADTCLAGLRQCSVPVFTRGLTSRPSINAAPLWPCRSG
jgi:hypothetical protein